MTSLNKEKLALLVKEYISKETEQLRELIEVTKTEVTQVIDEKEA